MHVNGGKDLNSDLSKREALTGPSHSQLPRISSLFTSNTSVLCVVPGEDSHRSESKTSLYHEDPLRATGSSEKP